MSAAASTVRGRPTVCDVTHCRGTRVIRRTGVTQVQSWQWSIAVSAAGAVRS